MSYNCPPKRHNPKAWAKYGCKGSEKFAIVMSPRLGVMSIGWEITDIIRRHNRFVFGYLESGKFSYIQHIAAF
jgi:hypothetical protein